MERKNTNLFFLSGIFLLFTLLLIGRSYKDQSVKSDKRQSLQKRTNRNTPPPEWLKNVSLENADNTVAR
ncbi:hypothetical protein [Xanthocytophaga agilis]|uniref:Uncharacterized protein n=1 Tax=Xanthocytophaga agilis TaxID=3048010 RepID=A0AAE3R6T5_9BACT|nr:hypothetical protein [Xanthocytophaga agilis]MDJ1504956.1 hypothetical protein [Xanthocytophaga agilis]